MRKRGRRRAVNSSGASGPARFAAIVGALLIVAGGVGWWLFASDDDSKLRRSCLDRLSVTIDRLDELSDAWERRSVPGEVKSKGGADGARARELAASSANDSPPKSDISERDKTKLRDELKTGLSGPEDVEYTVPEKDVSAKDQEKLRDLLKNLNQ